MNIQNPFTLNDWKFNDLLKVTIIIQILMIIIGLISGYSIHIPIIGDLVTLIYLTYIPGILILRIMKLHKLGNSYTVLLSVGLSILSVMIIGLLMNQLYPLIGIKEPITTIPLLVTLTIYNAILTIIAYKKDKEYYNIEKKSKIDFKLLKSNQFLFLLLLPLISIIGAYLLQYYGTNIIQILLLLLICVVIMIMVSQKLDEKYYSIAVFSIAISILYYSVLISNHIWGYDIFFEYQFATYVLKHGIWDSAWPHAYNAMLSVVMFGPIYSKLSGMTLTWVLKFVYPFLFSLISLGLYKIFAKHTGSKIAFLATFFFIAYNGFSYGWMVQMARQQIAEIFLVLLVWLMIDNKIPVKNKKILYVLFGIGLIVSHYSVTYLFMFMLFMVVISLILLSHGPGNIINNILMRFGIEKKYFGENFKKEDQTISLPITLILTAFLIIYYSLTADSKPIGSLFDSLGSVTTNLISILKGITHNSLFIPGIIGLIILLCLLYKIYKIISKDVDPTTVTKHNQIKKLITKLKTMSARRKYIIALIFSILVAISIWWPFSYMDIVSINATRVIKLSIYFIFVGFIMNLIQPEELHFPREYNGFAIFNMIIVLFGIYVPAFRGQLSLQRIYEVTFVILAPFCIIGAYYLCTWLIKTLTKLNQKQIGDTAIKLIGIFLIIFFLLNTGVIDLSVGQTAPLPLDTTNDAPLFKQSEYAGVAWFNNYRDPTLTVFSDAFGNILLYWLNDIRTTNPENTTHLDPGSYLFLRGYNIGHNTFLYGNGEYKSITETIQKSNKIYDSGNSQIYQRVYS
ncbi:MAG: DUF2206 domain-containing protein [Methanobacteriaceae archaeon]|nr:DUF2206 domain-containing protein [Methanobacteriaceae archaeon]